MTEIRVPTLGESVTEATIGKWFKKPGDAIKVDEPLVELETDKVTIEVPAPAAGVLAEIVAKDGETVGCGALLGQITAGAGALPRRPPRKLRLRQPRRQLSRPQLHRRESIGRFPPHRRCDGCRKRAAWIHRRFRHRQGWPRHQGRHAGGHRARRRSADSHFATRCAPCRCAHRHRPTTPRAKSA